MTKPSMSLRVFWIFNFKNQAIPQVPIYKVFWEGETEKKGLFVLFLSQEDLSKAKKSLPDVLKPELQYLI